MVVEILLAKGADINFVDKFGQTALTSASQSGYHDIVKLINDHIALQKVLQNLYMAKSMNSLSSHIELFDYDIMK